MPSVGIWNLVLNAADSAILVILIWLVVTHRTDIEHHVHRKEVENGATDVGTDPDVAGDPNRGLFPHERS